MVRHLGYVAIAKGSEARTNRVCRLAFATPKRLRELIAANLDGLAQVLAYNAVHGIRMYRITSDLVPFGSHPVNQLAWWDEFAPQLARLGAFIARNDMRVSMHPGQFAVLNAKRRAVVQAAFGDLAWHTRLLDALGTDGSSKVVIHIGGVYGDKRAAVRRFVRRARELPEAVRRRLILENDEHSYNAEEVLDIAAQTALPVVFDWLHHRANPGGARAPARAHEIIRACFATWGPADGLPKIHLSSQARGGRRGEHAPWVRITDLRTFLTVAPRSSSTACSKRSKRTSPSSACGATWCATASVKQATSRRRTITGRAVPGAGGCRRRR
jgi:UV DNA damage endonuclease